MHCFTSVGDVSPLRVLSLHGESVISDGEGSLFMRIERPPRGRPISERHLTMSQKPLKDNPTLPPACGRHSRWLMETAEHSCLLHSQKVVDDPHPTCAQSGCVFLGFTVSDPQTLLKVLVFRVFAKPRSSPPTLDLPKN